MTNRRRLTAHDAHRMLDDPGDLVTLSEAARLLDVAYGTIHKWVSSGRIAHAKKDRRVYVSLAEASAFERHARHDVAVRKGWPRGKKRRTRSDTPGSGVT